MKSADIFPDFFMSKCMAMIPIIIKINQNSFELFSLLAKICHQAAPQLRKSGKYFQNCQFSTTFTLLGMKNGYQNKWYTYKIMTVFVFYTTIGFHFSEYQNPGVNIFPFAPRYLGAEIRKIKDLAQNFSCLNNVTFCK